MSLDDDQAKLAEMLVSINHKINIMKNGNAVPAPRSIEELQKEVSKLDAMDTSTTQRVEKNARLEGLDSFDAERVYNELNLKATIMENIANKFYLKEVELKPMRGKTTLADEKWSDIYGHSANAYDDCARMLRDAMTEIIRGERYRQKLTNNLNK